MRIGHFDVVARMRRVIRGAVWQRDGWRGHDWDERCSFRNETLVYNGRPLLAVLFGGSCCSRLFGRIGSPWVMVDFLSSSRLMRRRVPTGTGKVGSGLVGGKRSWILID